MANGSQGRADEVTILEALLAQALERREVGGGGTAGGTQHHALGAARVHATSSARTTYVPPAQFEAAVASYSVQLQAWVNLQVDARLSQVLAEIAGCRQDGTAALTMSERLEGEMCAVTEAQSKLLAVMREHEAAIAELRGLSRDGDETKKQLQLVRSEVISNQLLESRLTAFHSEISSEVVQKIDAAKLAARSLEMIERAEVLKSQGSLESIRGELHAMEVRIEDAQRDFTRRIEDLREYVGREQNALQQRMMSMVRTELTAAFRTEAAEISAFDQKLRHKIDSLAQTQLPARRVLSMSTPHPQAPQLPPAALPPATCCVAEQPIEPVVLAAVGGSARTSPVVAHRTVELIEAPSPTMGLMQVVAEDRQRLKSEIDWLQRAQQ